MLRLLFIAYVWLAFVPLVVLSTLGFGLACLLTAPFLGPRAAGRLYAVPWARLGLMLSGVTVSVDGREHVDPRQSYVVVANHLSLFDIWVLYGYLDLDVRWVAKQEVRRIPVLGAACVMLGHVFIDRSHPDKAIASIKAAQDTIRDGTCMLFFPEGTRSRNGQLQPFKKGAFKVATEMGLPVLPVMIQGTYEILPPDSVALHPRHVHIGILPALAPQPNTECGVDELMWAAHARIEHGQTEDKLANLA